SSISHLLSSMNTLAKNPHPCPNPSCKKGTSQNPARRIRPTLALARPPEVLDQESRPRRFSTAFPNPLPMTFRPDIELSNIKAKLPENHLNSLLSGRNALSINGWAARHTPP